MSYLIDSDVVADYLAGIPQQVQRVSALVSRGIAISIITYGEIYDEIDGSRDSRAAEQVFRLFFRPAVVLPLNRRIMRQFASVRRDLRTRGLLIQDMNMLIGATALYHNLELVTRNAQHINRIPGLTLYP
jgi:predicted nucleic acid-binding protein